MAIDGFSGKRCNMQTSFPPWNYLLTLDGKRLSAVLVPLFRSEKGYKVLFLERPYFMKRHGGEMCFPGGERDDFDRGPLETALRETEEEIGLEREYIEPIYLMEPQKAVTSGFAVYPVVGVISDETLMSRLKLSHEEVAGIAFMQLDSIPVIPEIYKIEHEGIQFETPRYDLPDGRIIWGVTAFILYRFITMLRKGEINLCL